MVLKSAQSNPQDKKRPETPQIIITNKTYHDEYVNGIQLILDSYFSIKGIVEIHVGNEIVFDANDKEDLRQYRSIDVPVDSKKLKHAESVKIYLWNETDDDIVTLSANVALEESARNFTFSGIAVDPDQINRHVSGGSAISEDAQAIIDALDENGDGNQSSRGVVFNHQVYRDETNTQLIDMAGNKNMIVTMSASEIVLPNAIVGGGTLDDTGESTVYDTHNNNEKELKLILSLRTFTHYSEPSGPITVAIQISNSRWFNTFELVQSLTKPYIATGSNGWKSSTYTVRKTTTKRYLRIIVTSLDPDGAECYGTSLIDEKLSGGTAYLSFEIIDANGLWRTLDGMSSADIGTISEGGNVSKTFGAVSGLFIPSSQSLFRAKLHVSGGMEIGVSIIRGQ